MLPIAHRIRARVAEAAETQELIVEGVVCIADGVHPALIRARLRSFLRTGDDTPRNTLAQPNELAAGSGARGVSA
jgi:flagellar motor component MotA